MKLLLVEDDDAFAIALAADLAVFGHAVMRATDGREALVAIDRDQFDAVILDWMMPTMDGISVLQRLRNGNSAMPIIMLSVRGRSIDRIEGLDTGADDYVVKPVSGDELNARLNALLRARKWGGSSDDTLRVGDIVVSPGKFRAWRGERALELGNLEFKLLAELARNAGAVVTRAMLLERVWEYDFAPATNIVDAYIHRLRTKLGQSGEEDRIATVRGVGYMLRD